MSYIEIILLGLIQGITEFFPVSSSGHLLISKILLQTQDYGTLVDVVLHLGTLLSILIFWRLELKKEFKDVLSGSKEIVHLVFLGSIPTAIVGLTFKDYIQDNFFVSYGYNTFPLFLIINYFFMGIIVYISKYYHNNEKTKISYKHAFLIGVAQAVALMPGISRSGITIVVALLLGYNFKKALKFSFYLAIPILLFAGFDIYNHYQLLVINDKLLIPLLVGFISSAFFGYYILTILNKIIKIQKYWYFSIYCFLIFITLTIYNYGY